MPRDIVAEAALPEQPRVGFPPPLEHVALPLATRDEISVECVGPTGPLSTDDAHLMTGLSKRVGLLDEPRVRGRLADRDQADPHAMDRHTGTRVRKYARSIAARHRPG